MALRLRTVIAALACALSFGAAGGARAATATVTAVTAPEGYTRIQLVFDQPPETQARVSNNVLVISFSEPVEIKSQELGRGLGGVIGAVRRDPDGTAIRLALNGAVRLVSTAAGDRYFIDLLPNDWKGLPPPIPKDVIEQLSREAREARSLKAQEARLRADPQRVLTIEGATHPTFRRLIFRLGGDAPVDYRRSGATVAVKIDAPYLFDLPAAKLRLPLEFAGIEARRTERGLSITVPAPGTSAVRGFREDGDFILDIDRDDAPKQAAAQDGAAPAAAPDGHEPEHGATAPAHGDPAPAASAAAAAHGAKVSAPDPAPKAPAPAEPVAAKAPTPTADPAAKPAAVAPDRPPFAAQPEAPSIRRVGQSLRLTFPFARATPAAVFERGKTLWVVFDDPAPLKLDGFAASSGGAILGVEPVEIEGGRAARIRLAEPRLVSVSAEGDAWVVALGDDVTARSGPIEFAPAADRGGQPALQAELPALGTVRSIADPEIGDRLAVVTVGAPARHLPALRQFVEFAALPSAQGLALNLHSEDVAVVASIERVSIERPGGLTLSPSLAVQSGRPAEEVGDLVMDAASWAAANAVPFAERENELMRAAALSTPQDRPAARLALAEFYQARGRAADSAAVLGALVEDAGLSERDPRIGLLRAAAAVELGRPDAALAILSLPSLRMRPEAALWLAAAEELSGRLDQARAALKEGGVVIGQLPPELKARFTALGVRLALEAGDVTRAEALYRDLEILPTTEGLGAREILRARIEEGMGHLEKADRALAAVARRGEPAAAAEAELRSIFLGRKMKSVSANDATTRLERLTTGWRGDRIEAEALARLIDLYGAAGRWRDAFSTLRTAVEAFPDADDTRAVQDRMQERFTDLFLGGGVDKMPRLDALALFYDFKELLPGGKRGDELVRRLADKLVEVDLLDQAAELLGYQIENRLTGAARAQVASRAALIDLMNGKPAKAVELLRRTRQADLPSGLLKTRTRLEARALAETGRVDLALEMADGLEGAEGRALRADILWSARRWPEAGEALEAALGSVWRRPEPLDPLQRANVMRAAIAAALAGDGLAVDRIRQKYAAKMADSPEARSFEIVTAPVEARGDAFREVARSVAQTSSFQAFLDEYRRGASDPVPGQASNGDRPAGDKTPTKA